jgi:diguanylate cyclase
MNLKTSHNSRRTAWWSIAEYILMFVLISRQHFRWLLSAVVLLLSFQTLANSSAQLLALDKLKTQNFATFSSDLDALQQQQALMSADEKYYLKFLTIYRQIYQNGYAEVIADIEALLAQDISATLKFRLSALAVNALIITRDYKKAFFYADIILRLVRDIDDAFTLRQVLAPMALLFIDIGQKDIARFYIEQLSAVSIPDNNRCFAEYLNFRLHYPYSELEQLNELADIAIEHCNAVGELLWRDLTYVHWAKKLLNNDKVEQAAKLLDTFRPSATASTYPLLAGSAFAAEAAIAFKQKDNVKAKQSLQQAFEKAQFNESNDALLWANDTAYQLAYLEGNYKDALEYYIKFNQIAKKLDEERADKQLAFELAKSEIEVKNQRISLLNKDNELLILQKNVYQQEVKQNRLIMLVMVIGLTIATLLTVRAVSGRRRFRHMAEYDQLTGISNRYHFNNQAMVALNYCESNAKPVALILFDLDHFKTINDTHGHAAGDWALQAVVKTCRNFMRNNDVFGRIGGEEFAVVLPGCQADKAVLLAEICRDAIAGIDNSDSAKSFPITASFGVSSSQISGYQLKQLLADADSAMYQAKQDGRNRVVAFSR